MRKAAREWLIALNKHDLMPGATVTGYSHATIQTCAIRTSALTGEGIRQLREAILRVVTSGAPTTETALVTNLRQQQAISNSRASLARAYQAVASAIPHEMVLLDLYESLQSLDALTGVTTTDDILHLIFSTFCIGK